MKLTNTTIKLVKYYIGTLFIFILHIPIQQVLLNAGYILSYGVLYLTFLAICVSQLADAINKEEKDNKN